MALIAGRTAVYVSVDLLVMEIGRVIASMALGALEGRVGRGSAQCIRVAIGADAARSITAMIHREPGVSERHSQKTGRVVAGRACSGDDSRGGGVGGEVIRHRSAQSRGA